MSRVDEVQEPDLKKAKLDRDGDGQGANLVDSIEKEESENDSYDGYDDSDSDFSDEEERKEFRRICKQIDRSDGFDLDLGEKFSSVNWLTPIDFSNEEVFGGWIERMNFCVEETVKKNNEGGLKFFSELLGDPTLVCQFVDDKLAGPKILKANVSAMLYYITFEATSAKNDGQRRIYQLKVMDNTPCDERVIYILREKPGQS